MDVWDGNLFVVVNFLVGVVFKYSIEYKFKVVEVNVKWNFDMVEFYKEKIFILKKNYIDELNDEVVCDVNC